jgi:siroheme synthase
VRLKQGDPFVYGRGGEEVLYFREHGFESTVIPGVTSVIAGPEMVGIPVHSTETMFPIRATPMSTTSVRGFTYPGRLTALPARPTPVHKCHFGHRWA